MPNLVLKVIAGSALAFLTFLVMFCPCERLLCCHLGTFWMGLSVALAVVFYANSGFKLTDPTCY